MQGIKPPSLDPCEEMQGVLVAPELHAAPAHLSSSRSGPLMIVGGQGRWLHPRGHRQRPALSGGQQLPAQQGHRARLHRVAALLRSVGQKQRPSDAFGLLLLSSRLSERPVGCTQRSGIEEEQRKHERRSFGVSFPGLVACGVLLRM